MLFISLLSSFMKSYSFLQTQKSSIKVLDCVNSVLKVREEAIQKYSYNLQQDGWLNVFTNEKSHAMRNDGVSWRGAREKHHVFFSILLFSLTDKNDVIMDWQCGVGTHSLSASSLLWIFCNFFFTSFHTNLIHLFALGGSIAACRSLERHIEALESDPIIFNALLLPMRDPQTARTPRSVAPPSTSIFYLPQKMTKRAFGFLYA